MPCPRCGAPTIPGALSCTRCGASLEPGTAARQVPAASRPSVAARTRAQASAERTRTARTRTTRRVAQGAAPTVTPVSVKHGTQAADLGSSRVAVSPGYNPVQLRRRKQPWWQKALILVLVLGVVAAAGWHGSRWFAEQQAASQAAADYDAAHQSATVNVTLQIPNYLEGASSPVPIAVEGTDVDGQAVSRVELMSLTSHTVVLLNGTYTFRPVGSPITSSGAMYTVPEAQAVTIDQRGGQLEGPTFTYERVEAADITDEMMDAARAWMREQGIDTAQMQSWIDAVAAARATARKAAESAEERARREAESLVETDDFRFSIPEYWWGKVEAETTTDSAGNPMVNVKLAGTSYPLLQVVALSASEKRIDGDESDHLVTSIYADSLRIEMWSRNWARYAASGAGGVDDTDLKKLVRLSTGGLLDLDTARSMTAEQIGTPDLDFAKANIANTLKAADGSSAYAGGYSAGDAADGGGYDDYGYDDYDDDADGYGYDDDDADGYGYDDDDAYGDDDEDYE